MFHQTLLTNYPIISDQIKKPALAVVLSELEKVLAAGTAGDIVEFGCYIGTSSLFIQRLLDSYDSSSKRQFHAYDSFEGLPPKGYQDSSAAGVDFRVGELCVSKKQFRHEFQKAKLPAPIVHKAWFSGLSASDVPDQIAFAFLDSDFYASIIDSLRLVWPRLAGKGTIVIDDYQRETLPGVEQAINDFFQGKNIRLCNARNIAIITRV
jgi:O-methyltransferase